MKDKNLMFEKMLDDRFGMFVHYGIYSAFAGFYKGKSIPQLGEWIQWHAGIPIEEYEKFGRENFHTSPDFAKNLAKSAKKAGIRYIVLTSKHHDGFCLFNSAVSDYTSYAFYGRDICKELVDACREEGLEVGFYYSHTLDWHEKDAAGNVVVPDGIPVRHRNYWDFPDDNIDFEKYYTEKCLPQVTELLTNYGKLKLIWFDFPHDITAEQSERLYKLVKSLQPDCLVNSRICFGFNDYNSLDDNVLPVAPMGDNAECLITLNDTWGYRSDDHNWKSPEEVVDILCKTLTADASLLLNVGPMADGSLTSETHDILDKMGEWTARNGEAIFGGVRGNPLPVSFPWGYTAVKGNCLYMYVKDKSAKQLAAAPIDGEVVSVSIIGSDAKVEYTFENNKLVINTCKTDLMMPVYRVEFAQKPEFRMEIVQLGNEISLGVRWAYIMKRADANTVYKLRGNSDLYVEKKDVYINGAAFVENWNDPEDMLCWDVRFDEPGVYNAEVVHALADTYGDDHTINGSFVLSVGDVSCDVDMSKEKDTFKLSKSSKMNVRVVRDGGKFVISEAGSYKVKLSHVGDSLPLAEIKFIKE